MRAIASAFLHLEQGRSASRLRLAAVSVAALILATETGFAQNSGADSTTKNGTDQSPEVSPGATQKARRLETVSWNPVTDELTWVLSAGDISGGSYQPHSSETYLIHLESATMKVNGEGRRFSEDEADNVRTLIDILSRYTVESTVWWEAGMGQKLDGNGNPIPGQDKEEKPKSFPHVRTDVPIADTRQMPANENGENSRKATAANMSELAYRCRSSR